MSKSAKQGVVVAKRSGMVVGTGRSKSPGWKFVLVLAATLVVALTAGVTLRWLQDRGTFHPKALPTPVEQSQISQAKGDFDAARTGLQTELKKSNLTAQQKYDLNLQIATSYANQSKYQEALDNYKKAAQYKQTQNVYELMAIAAEHLGDKTGAVDYYKQAIQHIASQGNPLGDDDKARYNQIISEIEAGTHEL